MRLEIIHLSQLLALWWWWWWWQKYWGSISGIFWHTWYL